MIVTRMPAAAVAAVAVALVSGSMRAQQTSPPVAPAAVVTVPAGPAVNDVAPDFSLPGATRYGLLRNPVRLSDFRGRTVVLAFFFQARTKG